MLLVQSPRSVVAPRSLALGGIRAKAVTTGAQPVISAPACSLLFILAIFQNEPCYRIPPPGEYSPPVSCRQASRRPQRSDPLEGPSRRLVKDRRRLESPGRGLTPDTCHLTPGAGHLSRPAHPTCRPDFKAKGGRRPGRVTIPGPWSPRGRGRGRRGGARNRTPSAAPRDWPDGWRPGPGRFDASVRCDRRAQARCVWLRRWGRPTQVKQVPSLRETGVFSRSPKYGCEFETLAQTTTGDGLG